MNKRRYLITDPATETAHLSIRATCMHLLMCIRVYHSGKPIPADDVLAARLLMRRVSDYRAGLAELAAKGMWTRTPDGWQLAEEDRP